MKSTRKALTLLLILSSWVTAESDMAAIAAGFMFQDRQITGSFREHGSTKRIAFPPECFGDDTGNGFARPGQFDSSELDYYLAMHLQAASGVSSVLFTYCPYLRPPSNLDVHLSLGSARECIIDVRTVEYDPCGDRPELSLLRNPVSHPTSDKFVARRYGDYRVASLDQVGQFFQGSVESCLSDFSL